MSMAEKSDSGSSAPSIPEGKLPVIRICRSFRQAKFDRIVEVIGIYAQRLICFQAYKKIKLPATAYEPEGFAALSAVPHIGKAIDLTWDKISKAEICRSFDFDPQSMLSADKCTLRFTTDSGEKFEIALSAVAAERLIEAVKSRISDRVSEVDKLSPLAAETNVVFRQRKSRAKFYWKLYLLLPGVPLLIAAIAGAIPLEVFAIFAALLLFFPALAGFGVLLRKFVHKRQAKKAKTKPKPPAPLKDLSHWRPYRSRRIGLLLKVVGAAALVAGFFYSFLPLEGVPPQLWTFICYLPATCLIYAGYRLSLWSAEELRVADKRAPVLYLRSFSLDARNTLNPSGALPQFLGVQSITALGPLGNVNPVRLIRLLFSRASDHVEEQLASTLNHVGPFVAIGQPGERLALGGAARLYVGNDEWKNAVERLTTEAAVIVLQPADTEHMWWEIGEVLKHAERKNVLFLLTAFRDQQWLYEKFSERLERESGCSLPRCLGDNCFLYFNGDNGRLLPVVLRPPVLWPISGLAVDLEKTLEPFFASRAGRPDVSPAKPGLLSRFFRSSTLALAVWGIATVLTVFSASFAVDSIDTWRNAVRFAAEAAPGRPTVTIEGPEQRPYRLELPAYWAEHQEKNVPTPLFFSGKIWAISNFGLFILVSAEPPTQATPSTSAEYADHVISLMTGPDSNGSVIDRQSTEANGLTWEVVKVLVREEGGFFTKAAQDAGALYQKPSTSIIKMYLHAGADGAIQFRGGVHTPYEKDFEPIFDDLFSKLTVPSQEQIAAQQEMRKVDELSVSDGTIVRWPGNGYWLSLNSSWQRTQADPMIDSAYAAGETAVVLVLREDVRAYPGYLSNQEYARLVMEDLQTRDTSAQVLDQTPVESDGIDWYCVRYTSTYGLQTVKHSNYMTVRPDGFAYQLSFTSSFTSNQAQDAAAQNLLRAFSFR